MSEKPDKPQPLELPAHLPGPREVKLRLDSARRMLEGMELEPVIEPLKLGARVAGIARALLEKGVLTREELDYYMLLQHMEELEGLLNEARKRNLIHLPGGGKVRA